MVQKYPKLGVVEFGEELFATGDLDPVYVALNKVLWKDNQLKRWLVAYWSFYHCGFACYASEHRGTEFWEVMVDAAENASEAPVGGRWPRGTERRHFRGDAAINGVASLMKRYDCPEDMVDYLMGGVLTVPAIMKRMAIHKYFGRWVGFKAADMIDVCFEDVDQSATSMFLYETPRKSILEHIEKGTFIVPTKHLDEESKLEYGMSWLWMQLKDMRIPHKPEKAPDWFSLETVWCKHLSHLHGHYPVNKDIIEIHHGLEPWVKLSRSAAQFKKGLPCV